MEGSGNAGDTLDNPLDEEFARIAVSSDALFDIARTSAGTRSSCNSACG